MPPPEWLTAPYHRRLLGRAGWCVYITLSMGAVISEKAYKAGGARKLDEQRALHLSIPPPNPTVCHSSTVSHRLIKLQGCVGMWRTRSDLLTTVKVRKQLLMMWRQFGFYSPNNSFSIRQQSSFRLLVNSQRNIEPLVIKPDVFSSVFVIISELQSWSFHFYLNVLSCPVVAVWSVPLHYVRFLNQTQKWALSSDHQNQKQHQHFLWSVCPPRSSGCTRPSVWIKLRTRVQRREVGSGFPHWTLFQKNMYDS